MRKLLLAAIAVAAPGVLLAHYYFVRPIANPVAVVGAPVVGAATTSTLWACVRADGTVNGTVQATQAAAEAPCGGLVATDGVTRYLEERVTVTQASTSTTSTRRFEVLGGTTLKVADAHAQFIGISNGGGGGPTVPDAPLEGHDYYTSLTNTPTHGTAHFNIDFRSAEDIVTWDASPNTPGHTSFYDSGEDATCWEFLGTAGNYAGIANGFRGAFTAITSGRAMAYLEVKFIGDWLADIDGATVTPLRVWKDYHIKVNNTESVDRELRYRFDLAPRSGTNVASIDLRTYGSPGTTPSGEWQISTGHFTQFLVQEEKWTRIWRYEDLDTDVMTIWVGDEDRAPVKIMDAVSFTALANWAGFTYQHITSQDTGNSGAGDVSFCTRNFAIVRAIDDIADAQALVDEGDQTL
jgi:hypothetical protein